MKKNHTSRSGFFKPGVLFSSAFGALAVLALAFYATAQAQTPKKNASARLNAAEAKVMAEGLKPLLKLNDSSEGLSEVRHADGSASTDLQGRFQNVTVAVKDANGAVTQGCVNNTEAAAGFFGIDRQLLGLAAKPEPAKLSDR